MNWEKNPDGGEIPETKKILWKKNGIDTRCTLLILTGNCYSTSIKINKVLHPNSGENFVP